MHNLAPAPQCFHVLVCDAVGLKLLADGTADISEVKDHIEKCGSVFHTGTLPHDDADGKIHFYYWPHLSTEAELLAITSQGQFDAVIAAATFIPPASVFKCGGVRIGAGSGNMGSTSWGGGNGVGGAAPLMNTPSFNSRATAQMAFKAVLQFLPDLPFSTLHTLSISGQFDTGKNLAQFPTEKLEGKTIAILGFGNIGREVALLARSFHLNVKIFARAKYQKWIEAEGFEYCDSIVKAAQNADIISVHLGLGGRDVSSGRFENENIISTAAIGALKPGAMLLNFDRGECVDSAALQSAMATGQIKYAAIDADIFVGKNGNIAGPLSPYIALATEFGQRLLLLPHAAADTCHTSRVEGAKQAVNQIIECLLEKRVTNLKGQLPTGYVSGGATTVLGIGKVDSNTILAVASNPQKMQNVTTLLQDITLGWETLLQALNANDSVQVQNTSSDLLLALNKHNSLMRGLGLEGPIDL
jgi:lactate dehydrogenase-like 2-hydroxyacid dehydrogenase